MAQKIAEHKYNADASKMGALLKELRLGNLLTQQETADALHVPKSTYSNWERGVYLPATSAMRKIKSMYPQAAGQLHSTYMSCKIKNIKVVEQ